MSKNCLELGLELDLSYRMHVIAVRNLSETVTNYVGTHKALKLSKYDVKFWVSVFVMLLVGSYLLGQRGGSTLQMGNHSIEIHLLNERGSALNLNVKVEILTDGGMRMAESYSNREEGVADFEGFNDGVFQLRISGPGIDTVSQTFQITATEATHREYVRIQVKRPDVPGESASPGSDPTVSTEDLSVPAKAREEFAKGMEAHANGDDRTAQASLEHALEIYPNYVKARNNLGVLYLKAGLKDKASAEFAKALEFAPKFAPAYVNLAKIAISNGNYSEAELQLKKALTSDPSALNAMVLLCSTEFARQEYSDALALIRHVHQLTQDQQYADIHLLAADILLSQKKPRDAAAEYELFMKENPTDSRVPKVKSLSERLAK
jgi:Tfp pilus assembly protein PilF